MQAHRAKENHDSNNVWVLSGAGIDSNDHMKEQESSENKVDIHKEMTSVIAHQIAEEVGEIENKE
jgi:hypothetical protein